jgi:hypothetical protein
VGAGVGTAVGSVGAGVGEAVGSGKPSRTRSDSAFCTPVFNSSRLAD